MEGTASYIPITAPLYGNGYGNGYGQNDRGLESQINQLADQVSANGIKDVVRGVGNDVNSGVSSVKETVQAVNNNVTNGNYTHLTGLNDLGRDINHTINRETIAWMDSIHKSDLANMNSFNNTNRELAAGFNQSFLQSKDITADMARCCCELKSLILKENCDTKELIREQNTQTRDLITSNRILELERKLNDEKSEISNLKQTNVLLKAIGKISVED